jgi:hypothetical protein
MLPMLKITKQMMKVSLLPLLSDRVPRKAGAIAWAI